MNDKVKAAADPAAERDAVLANYRHLQDQLTHANHINAQLSHANVALTIKLGNDGPDFISPAARHLCGSQFSADPIGELKAAREFIDREIERLSGVEPRGYRKPVPAPRPSLMQVPELEIVR